MEKGPRGDEGERREPPPFDPDPNLITTLEGGRKPTPEEVRKMAERTGLLPSEGAPSRTAS
jgi:hypothetical protein